MRTPTVTRTMALGTGRAIVDVLFERARQIEIEGFTPDHDDEHVRAELASAAACYAMPYFQNSTVPAYWPWSPRWWKPSESRRRDLVKAAALMIAEIERIDRATAELDAGNPE